jgi:hypothetical protein
LEELNDGNNTENNSSENNNQNTSNAAEREGNNDPVSGSVDDDIQSGAVGQILDNVCVHCFCDPCDRKSSSLVRKWTKSSPKE